jgi:hypothetical protein
VQIQSITIDTPYACNVFGPKSGFLPEDFPYSSYKIVPLDLTCFIVRILRRPLIGVKLTSARATQTYLCTAAVRAG